MHTTQRQEGLPVAWQCPAWVWGPAGVELEVGWPPARPLGVLSAAPHTAWPVHSLQPPPPAPAKLEQQQVRHRELLMASFGFD